MVLPETLSRLARFIASPWGLILIIAWMFGGIWSAYRRLKARQDRDKH